MSSPSPLFGASYLNGQDFLDNAATFGCAALVVGYDATGVSSMLAAASREVDVELGRSFSADLIAENHRWDGATRRVKVNQPPVIELQRFSIRVGAGLRSSFTVTPVETDDAGNPVRFGTVYYNREENYLEVTSLALAGSLVSPIVTLGLTDPQVEIAYKSLPVVPYEVMLAVGYTAAYWLSEAVAASMIPQGLASLRDDDTEVKRQPQPAWQNRGLPPRAKSILRGLSRIAIG